MFSVFLNFQAKFNHANCNETLTKCFKLDEEEQKRYDENNETLISSVS